MIETALTCTVLINIGNDHSFNCTDTTLGRSGENNTTRFEISVPKELTSFDPYLDFMKPTGETVRTPRLAIDGNKIEYDIPLWLIDTKGKIEVQLIFQDQRGFIWKSARKTFSVLKSINAVDDIPEKEDFITEAQKLLDEIKDASAAVTSTIGSVDLIAANWEGTGSPYSQVVNINGATEYSKVDLNPTVEQLSIFHNKDIAFVTENDGGVITVYCIGQKPLNDYTMQVTLTEVVTNG